HLAVEGGQRPLALVVTAGQRGDSPQFAAVLGGVRVPRLGPGRPRTRPDRVLADKAYSSKANRALLRRRGVRAVIPEKDDPAGYWPTRPSIRSRMRSAWPLCRAYSSIVWIRTSRSGIGSRSSSPVPWMSRSGASATNRSAKATSARQVAHASATTAGSAVASRNATWLEV